MSMIKGLASIKANQKAQQERAEAATRPKGEWFKFQKGVSAVEVRFLQELDEDMSGYREDRGVGFIANEHNAPGNDGWKRRALCTATDDESPCYACERHKADYRAGWRQKQNLYINVLVKVGDEFKTMILTRNANSSFAQALIEEAVDEGTITAVNYRITKTGEGTTTQWLLKALKTEPFDDSNAEVFDLEKTALREVEYDKQAAYYGEVFSDEPASEVSAAAPTAESHDDEW